MVFGLQLVCGLQLYAQQPNLGATAEAKTGHLHHASILRAAQPPTPPASARRARSRDTTLTQAACHGFLRARYGAFTTFDARVPLAPPALPHATALEHQPGGRDHGKLLY